MSDPAAPTSRAGRPRCEDTHRSILAAAQELLIARSYNEVSIEAVAARAGVSKTSIYRRWNSKAELAIEVLLRYALDVNRPYLAMDFRSHLLEGMRGLRDMLSGPLSDTIAAVIAEAQANGDLRKSFYRRFIQEMQNIAGTDLERAIERGEMLAAVDRELMFDQLFGTLHYRLLVVHERVDDAYLERLVDSVLTYQRRS